jgi:hypothetical protein
MLETLIRNVKTMNANIFPQRCNAEATAICASSPVEVDFRVLTLY